MFEDAPFPEGKVARGIHVGKDYFLCKAWNSRGFRCPYSDQPWHSERFLDDEFDVEEPPEEPTAFAVGDRVKKGGPRIWLNTGVGLPMAIQAWAESQTLSQRSPNGKEEALAAETRYAKSALGERAPSLEALKPLAELGHKAAQGSSYSGRRLGNLDAAEKMGSIIGRRPTQKHTVPAWRLYGQNISTYSGWEPGDPL